MPHNGRKAERHKWVKGVAVVLALLPHSYLVSQVHHQSINSGKVCCSWRNCNVKFSWGRKSASQDLLHSSYFCLCQVAIWLVAEWITSGCLKLGSIHPSFKKPFMKYPRNSSWAVTKHPKHKSKMGLGGDRNREHSLFVATPFLQICGAGSNFLLRFFSARLCSWGWEPFFWSSSEVGVKIPFLSEGSPVMKRAFHSAWVGPEQRAATLWKAWAKSPLLLLLGRKGGRSPRPSKGGGAAGTADGLPGCARAELWMQAVEKLGSP